MFYLTIYSTHYLRLYGVGGFLVFHNYAYSMFFILKKTMSGEKKKSQI